LKVGDKDREELLEPKDDSDVDLDDCDGDCDGDGEGLAFIIISVLLLLSLPSLPSGSSDPSAFLIGCIISTAAGIIVSKFVAKRPIIKIRKSLGVILKNE
jgi:hypothetical protein